MLENENGCEVCLCMLDGVNRVKKKVNEFDACFCNEIVLVDRVVKNVLKSKTLAKDNLPKDKKKSVIERIGFLNEL